MDAHHLSALPEEAFFTWEVWLDCSTNCLFRGSHQLIHSALGEPNSEWGFSLIGRETTFVVLIWEPAPISGVPESDAPF